MFFGVFWNLGYGFLLSSCGFLLPFCISPVFWTIFFVKDDAWTLLDCRIVATLWGSEGLMVILA